VIKEVRLSCADEDRLKVRVKAEDRSGLGHMFLSFGATTLISRIELIIVVSKIDLFKGSANDCVFDGEIEVALSDRALAQLHWASRLLGEAEQTSRTNQALFKATFGEGPAKSTPLRYWLTARICNQARQCSTTLVATDRQYKARLQNGCSKNSGAHSVAKPMP
jgi:hypothetical protein